MDWPQLQRAIDALDHSIHEHGGERGFNVDLWHLTSASKMAWRALLRDVLIDLAGQGVIAIPDDEGDGA